MKIIPKLQTGGIALSDNTRVVKPIFLPTRKYLLKEGETFFYDYGKPVLIRSKNEQVSQDNRTQYLKKKSLEKTTVNKKKVQDLKIQKEGMKGITAMTKLVSPSTYVGPIFDNSDKPYFERVLGGEGTGNSAGNFVLDVATPMFGWLGSKGVSLLPKIKWTPKLKSIGIDKVNTSWNPYTYFSKENNAWNMAKIQESVQKGRDDAVSYFKSNIKREVDAHNQALARRIGLNQMSPNLNAAERTAIEPKKIGLVFDPRSSEMGSVNMDFDPSKELVTVNLAGNLENTMFHESLHRGGLGMMPLQENTPRVIKKLSNNFYEWLTDKLLKKPGEVPDLKVYDYLSKPGEAAANMMETGREMGLRIGLKYPGRSKMFELINTYKNSDGFKSGIFDYINLEHPKRVWNALTGKYYILWPTTTALWGLSQSDR